MSQLKLDSAAAHFRRAIRYLDAGKPDIGLKEAELGMKLLKEVMPDAKTSAKISSAQIAEL